MRLLDYAAYGAAAVGGVAAVWWIYNSMVRGRREYLRLAARTQDPVLLTRVKQGIFLQRASFGVAAVATSVAILAFAHAYYNKHGYHIATPYFALAVILMAGGSLTIVVAFLRRHRL